LSQNPDYALILACHKKYFDVLNFYRGYSDRITGFYAYEGYDETWPAQKDIDFFNDKKVDTVFNAMAQHKDYYWAKNRHQAIECGDMFDIKVVDPQIRLPFPAKRTQNKNYIALSLFPNNGEGMKSISVEKANQIVAYCKSKGYEVLQLNRAPEVMLQGVIRTNTDFYSAALQMLGCRMLIVGDTAMSWIASAFEIPVVGLYALDYYPFCSSSKNWNPINKNALYLEAPRAEDIPNDQIFKAIDAVLDRTTHV
jgi:hypothetical protein